MAKEVGFGILGLGRGRKTAQIATQTAGANLACVCDLQEEKAKAIAQELGCDWTTSYDHMLARDDIDAIGIYTSSGTHAKFANQAIAVGKHVFVTKPMDIDLNKCDHLIEAAKKANLVLAVDFIRRYRKTDHQVRKAIVDGLIGNIILGDLRMKCTVGSLTMMEDGRQVGEVDRVLKADQLLIKAFTQSTNSSGLWVISKQCKVDVARLTMR